MTVSKKELQRRIEQLQQELDLMDVERTLFATDLHHLREDKQSLQKRLHAANEEISDLKHKLAEERAWGEIVFEESENVRKSLHAIHTVWQREMLEEDR